jgi:hypothetical protein
VTVGGVRMNKHEYNEETHGPADKGSGRKTGGASKDDFEEMTVPELQENLSRRGIEYTSEDRKDDLVKKARKGK